MSATGDSNRALSEKAMRAANDELVLIIDFGAQYNQLIARRVRELGVYCEIIPHLTPVMEIAARRPKAIILTGGPSSVYDAGSPGIDRSIFDLGIPVLGICYGMQLMAYLLGGQVERAEHREYGKAVVEVEGGSPLFQGLETSQDTWMSHGDLVTAVPEGFEVMARSENTPLAAMGHRERRLYGVQFHPEVEHTEKGREILRGFLYDVAGCQGNWTMASFVDEAIAAIRHQVGEDKAICGLSGGVDSSVAAALVHRAIGDNLTCIFIDHGFMRKGEAEQVIETFDEHFHMNLVVVDARERFLARLDGVMDPEEKRKIIGEEFIRVFEEEADRIGPVKFLVQGTIYPDVIESGIGSASVIKSHHNVGGLPEDMDLELVEPMKELFKDEVRRVGEELGLPAEMVWRQPFPGPGLAIRIIGEITRERLEILREADAIVRQELAAAGLERELWQSFAALPVVRSVGVMGDERTYAYPIILRAVTSSDAMTADWARLPYDVLDRISRRVVNEVDHVNRLLYDVTSKPPGTIEWE